MPITLTLAYPRLDQTCQLCDQNNEYEGDPEHVDGCPIAHTDRTLQENPLE